jgi:hypothetical protein
MGTSKGWSLFSWLVAGLGAAVLIGLTVRRGLRGPTCESRSAVLGLAERGAGAPLQGERGTLPRSHLGASPEPGQVADVTIRVAQHGRGPLTAGEVKPVEYTFGPRFQKRSIVRNNASEDFAYTTSMYDQMLCLAKVYFTNGRPPLTLDRYINFEGARDNTGGRSSE